MTITQNESEQLLQKLMDIQSSLTLSGPLGALNRMAWEKLFAVGLPTKKWEAFQYLSLHRFYREVFSNHFAKPSETLIPKKPTARQIVFNNGHFAPSHSSIEQLTAQGAVILPLSRSINTYSAILANRIRKGQEKESNPFALLNYAGNFDGLFIYVPPGCRIEEEVVLRQKTEANGISLAKIFLFLGKNSSFNLTTIAEAGENAWANSLLDLSLDEGASLTRSFASECANHASYVFENIRANLKRDSQLRSFSLTQGAKAIREDIQVSLSGENAEADLKGLAILSGKNENHTHILMHHQAPHCRSNQQFRSVNAGSSMSSFEGKIYVDSIAQKTEGYQLNNNLLLDSAARAYTKPNLEIFADDVKASHGATVAKLSEEELFYLKTRGLSSAEAMGYVVQGFCREILNSFPSIHLRRKGQEEMQKLIEDEL